MDESRGKNYDGVMPSARFEPDAAQSEGGEALSTVRTAAIPDATAPRSAATPSAQWYALWTRSHTERLVYEQLAAKGFDAFLPTAEVWSWRARARHRIQVPIFPGYLFLRHALGKPAVTQGRQVPGLG